MAKKIALLDVDDTLYFNYHPLPLDPKRINFELLQSLKKRGITELYLFTDMVMEDSVIAHRLALIELLMAQGFIVHGVITPNDLLWDNYWFYKNITHRNNYSALFIRNSFKRNTPGSAFKEAVKEIANWEALSQNTKQKSFWIARGLIPQFLKRMGHTNPKGLMLELFLHHLPGGIEQIVVIDDRSSVLDSVRAYMRMAGTLDFKLPTIDIIHVNNQSEGCYYQERISKQTRNITQADFAAPIIRHTIQHEITRLSSNVFFLRNDAKKMIQQLILLKEQIERELKEPSPTHHDSHFLFLELQQNTMFHEHFMAYLRNFYAINIYVEKTRQPILERHDVQLILKEVSRLRHDTMQHFFTGKQEKADLIEKALLEALHRGAEDVTQDVDVLNALQHHRLFNFFGYKKAAALLNVEQACFKAQSAPV